MSEHKEIKQRVLVTYPTKEGPMTDHSWYSDVVKTEYVGGNILHMVHTDDTVSVVVLGKGYTVTFFRMEDTAS